MAKQPKVAMPQSTAGLVRYFEASKDAVKLKPEHVAAICIILCGLVLSLRFVFV